MFYLIRHGKTDYSEINTNIYQGFGSNLARLSELGIRQIQETAGDPRLRGAEPILSAPSTRALHSAAIPPSALDAEIVVETDLHEWLANKNYIYEDDETAERAYLEYEACGGVYPAGEERAWEDAASIRARVLPVLRKYARYGKVIVACHGMMIRAVAGGEHPVNGGIVEFKL